MVARLEASIVPVLAFSHTRSQVCAIASNLRKWPAIIRGITLTRKHCANFNCPVGATSPVPRRGVHFMAGPAQTMCKTPVRNAVTPAEIKVCTRHQLLGTRERTYASATKQICPSFALLDYPS